MISVIVPIYNTASSLSACIDSILNSTYGDFELILVNDGSTDNSLELCKEYCRRDDRVRLIDQENQGASVARNPKLFPPRENAERQPAIQHKKYLTHGGRRGRRHKPRLNRVLAAALNLIELIPKAFSQILRPLGAEHHKGGPHSVLHFGRGFLNPPEISKGDVGTALHRGKGTGMAGRTDDIIGKAEGKERIVSVFLFYVFSIPDPEADGMPIVTAPLVAELELCEFSTAFLFQMCSVAGSHPWRRDTITD